MKLPVFTKVFEQYSDEQGGFVITFIETGHQARTVFNELSVLMETEDGWVLDDELLDSDDLTEAEAKSVANFIKSFNREGDVRDEIPQVS